MIKKIDVVSEWVCKIGFLCSFVYFIGSWLGSAVGILGYFISAALYLIFVIIIKRMEKV